MSKQLSETVTLESEQLEAIVDVFNPVAKLVRTKPHHITETGVELWRAPHISVDEHSLDPKRVQVYVCRFPNKTLNYLIAVDGKPWYEHQQTDGISLMLAMLPLQDPTLRVTKNV